MACTMNRSDVSETVIRVIGRSHPGKTITEATQFWKDLNEGRVARQRHHSPVRVEIEAQGCELKKVKRAHWKGYLRVSDPIDKIIADLDEQRAQS